MPLDWSRVPVVVGAGQVTNREEDPLSAPDPFALMEQAARDATASIRAAVLGGLTHVWMVHSLSLRHGDPAPHLARALGAEHAETRCSGMGGSIPQWLVDRACEEVVSGTRPRVLIVGAEALATRRRAKRAGVTLDWPNAAGWPDTWPPLEPDLGVHPVERSCGLDQATAMYALIESAVAHQRGETPDVHLRSMARLMERFNAVARTNPLSWFDTPRSAQDLMTVTEANRMIYFPYPKYMNAVMDVDMAAGIVVTDAQTAREWGLASEDVVYVSGWADAHDVWYLSERPGVERSAALEACATASLSAAGLTVDDVSAFDLYSCFPSSIEVALDSLGLSSDDPRPITLTGGLPYHGGPGSNYVTHAIANAREWLRASKGESVLVHGNGYYLTKHAVGVYTRTAPGRAPYEIDALEDRIRVPTTSLRVESSADGAATVVAYTAPYSRDGSAQSAIVLAEVDGTRTLARADEELTTALVGADAVGTKVRISPGPEHNTARLL